MLLLEQRSNSYLFAKPDNIIQEHFWKTRTLSEKEFQQNLPGSL